MGVSNLRGVERKVLGALLILADEKMEVQCNLKTLASTMGYKAVGGAITFAIEALEMKNYINREDGKYLILI